MNNEVTNIPVQRSKAAQAYLNTLFSQMRDYFDVEEMRLLCFHLGINYDDLGERGRAANIRELLLHLAQARRLPELIDICRQERPTVEWTERPASLSENDLVLAATPTISRKRHQQLILLERVYEFWIEGVLERSVHHEALIELNKRELETAVSKDNPWQMVLTTPEGTRKRPLPGASIFDIFMEMDRSLLILGEPGAGKTITLLELARDLIDRAYQNPAYAIPVVLSLSTWRGEPLVEWLTAELCSKYKIPKAIGKNWIMQDDLLLLLDSLDEVPAAQREDAIEAINAYRADHGVTGIAVCSRHQEYEASAIRLQLDGAVQLEPLSPEQIDLYLQRTGAASTSLRQRIAQDISLQELTKTPLMLSVMTLAYGHSTENESIRYDEEISNKQLFDAYVRRLLTSHRTQNEFTPQQTITWLHCLAQKLSQHEQTEFFMEEMQPSWLPERRQQIIHSISTKFIVVLLFALAAVIFVILNHSVAPPGETMADAMIRAVYQGGFVIVIATVVILIGRWLPMWLAVMMTAVSFLLLNSLIQPNNIILATLYGLAAGGTAVAAAPNDQIKFTTVNFAWRNAIWGILVAIVGFIGIIFVEGNLILSSITLLVFLLGLLSTIPLILVGRYEPLDEVIFPNQGVINSAKNTIKLGGFVLIMALLIGLLISTVVSLRTAEPLAETVPNSLFLSLFFGFPLALIVALFYGGNTTIQFFLLRIQLSRTGVLPWNLTAFLDYTTRCVFLQQVGGGYIFIHRLFLEYFADPHLPESKFVQDF